MTESYKKIAEKVAKDLETFGEVLFLEPRDMYDPCIIGLKEEENPKLVYSESKIIEALRESYKKDDVLEGEDHHLMAIEWFEFNIEGAYLGPNTPEYVKDYE